jgi:hypothetical protein
LGKQGWENTSEKQSIETLLGESVIKQSTRIIASLLGKVKTIKSAEMKEG